MSVVLYFVGNIKFTVVRKGRKYFVGSSLFNISFVLLKTEYIFIFDFNYKAMSFDFRI